MNSKLRVRCGQVWKDVNGVKLLVKKVDECNGIIELEDLNSFEMGFSDFSLTNRLGGFFNLIRNKKVKLICDDINNNLNI